MKRFLFILTAILAVAWGHAQNTKQTLEKKKNIQCETLTCYTVTANDFVFNTWQSVYNALYAKVPGIQIYNTLPSQTPVIRLRNQTDHVVYIDGVRTTMSALQMLNPADIESITLLPNAMPIPPAILN